MITQPHVQEGFNRAFLYALAAGAGLNVSMNRAWDYKVDGTFSEVAYQNGTMFETGFSLDFQLKASINWRYEQQTVKYDLDASEYNDLARRRGSRRQAATAKILILLCLPPNLRDNLDVSPVQMSLRRACYWFMPETEQGTQNTSKIRISLPCTNLVTHKTLKNLVDDVREGRM